MEIVRVIDSVSNRKDDSEEARNVYYPRLVIALLCTQPAAVQRSAIGVQA